MSRPPLNLNDLRDLDAARTRPLDYLGRELERRIRDTEYHGGQIAALALTTGICLGLLQRQYNALVSLGWPPDQLAQLRIEIDTLIAEAGRLAHRPAQILSD